MQRYPKSHHSARCDRASVAIPSSGWARPNGRRATFNRNLKSLWWGVLEKKRRKYMKPSTKDQIKGSFHEMKGEAKEKAGQVTNNPNLAAKGQNEKLAGKVQKKVGQIEKGLGKKEDGV